VGVMVWVTTVRVVAVDVMCLILSPERVSGRETAVMQTS
jgi:hypothetical protein